MTFLRPRRLSSRRWPLLPVAVLLAAACGADGEAPPSANALPEDYVPAAAPMRRLLGDQYTATVGQLLGPEAAAAADPPVDAALNGYRSIAAAQFAMNDDAVRAYEQSARAVATAAIADGEVRSAAGTPWLDCTPTSATDEECLERFARRFARVAFRRPLEDDEVAALVDVGLTAGRQLGRFDDAMAFVVSTVLQSPSFLFLTENGVSAPGLPEGWHVLSPYEYASRVSLFLAGQGPDEALLDRVEAGELDTEEGRAFVVQELLASPTAPRALDHFFTEYLDLEGLETKAKDPNVYEFDAELAATMREETLRFMRDIVWERDVDVRSMLTSNETFLNPTLAAHYGIEVDADGWAKVALPPEQGRSGILTQASVMTKQAHSGTTSVTYRGLLLWERLLCRTMPSPPPDVVTTLPESSSAPTMRERLAVHLTEPSCATCHAAVDTLGLVLETFDGVGQHRTTENGALIDTTVDHPSLGPLENAQQLGVALANDPEVSLCMVRNVFRYATGHVESDAELAALQGTLTAFANDGFRMKQLLFHLATSPAFRVVAAPELAMGESR